MSVYKKLRAVALATLAAVFLIVAPLSVSGLLGGGRTVTAQAAAGDAAYREYTNVDVELSDGNYSVYENATTVGGLKKNLRVRGTTNIDMTFNDGDTYELYADEYEIRINGETPDGGDAHVISAGDVTVNGATGAKSLAVTVTCGTLTADIVLPVADGAPSFGGLKAALKSGVTKITDDYTADTIHKLLTVTVGESELSPDLYSVEMEDIYNKSSARIVVTAADGSESDEITVSVERARLTGVELKVKPQYKLGSDGRYKDGNADVFVQGATPETVYGKFDVIATFANGRRTLILTSEQNIPTGTTTGESVTASLQVSAPEQAAISIQVTRDDATAASGAVTVLFAKTEIIKIEVDESALASWIAANGDSFTPYYSLPLTEMAGIFTLRRNDGGAEQVTSGNIRVDGSLAPDAATADTLSDGQTYDKRVKVVSSANAEVYTFIDITGIKFKTPASLAIEGEFATQMKHHAVNYDGLTLVLNYKEGNRTYPARVPLSDYSKYLSAVIYSGDTEQDLILGDTDYLQVNIDYNGKTAEKSDAIIPVNDRVPIPMTDTSSMTYYEGCFKQFTGFDGALMEFGNLGGYATVSGDKVIFNGGGDYAIEISLKSDADGNLKGYPLDEYDFYYDGTTPTGVSISADKHTVTYSVRINKGMLAVNVSLNTGDPVRYGDDLNALIAVTGTSNGKTTPVSELGVQYKLVLIRKGEAFDYDNCTYLNYTPRAKIDAGVYTVYAVTGDSEAYLAGKVRANKGITVTVLPKELDGGNAAQTIVYDREEHALTEFVKPDGLVNGDTAAEVMDITVNGESLSAVRYAGEYAVTMTVKTNGFDDEYNYNYLWSGDKTSVESKFEITKKTFDNFYLALGKTEYYYGESAQLPQADAVNGDDGYFTAGAASYYKLDGENEILMTETDFAAFGVGNYRVRIALTANLVDGENREGSTVDAPLDFDLPNGKYADFTVKPAELKYLSVDGFLSGGTVTLGGYLSAGYEKTVENLDAGALNGAAGKTAYDGVQISFAYKALADGYSYAQPELDADGRFILTDAGEYKITIALKDDFVWADGTGEDIVYTVNITRAAVDSPELSDGFTYDGGAHTVSVVNWDALNGVAEFTVTGSTLAAAGISVTPTGGAFAVTEAGEYGVKFELLNKNNYKWLETDGVAAVTEVYTVEQAALKVSWNKTTVGFDESAAVQDTDLIATAIAGVPNAAMISVVKASHMKVYSDADCNNEIEWSGVTRAQTYYVKVIDFAISGGLNKLNYKLGDDSLLLAYEITSSALEKPELYNGGYDGASVSGNSVSAIYKGGEYYLKEFIREYQAKFVSPVHGDKLVITVSGGERIKTVKPDGGSYTVTVKPAENFRWSDNTDGGIVYTFTVTKFTVQFGWVTPDFTYDGTAHKPVANANNLFAGDKVMVTVADGAGGTDAGRYSVLPEHLSLSGADAGNYTLDGTASQTTYAYAVKRAVVGTPYGTDGDLQFNGGVQEVTYTLPVSGVPAGGTAVWNFVSVTAVDALGGVMESAGGNYSYAAHTLNFYHAGEYTLTYALNGNNYCYDGAQAEIFDGEEGFTLEYIRKVEVARKAVTAPALGANRAMELGDGKLDAARFDYDLGVGYLRAFGNYLSGAIIDVENATLGREVYFVKFTFNPVAAGGLTPEVYDYIWVENDGDKDYSSSEWGYLNDALKDATPAERYGKTEDNGTVLYLNFVITKTQINDLTFEFAGGGYTFGDNGWIAGGTLAGDKAFDGADLTLFNITAKNPFITVNNNITENADAGKTAHSVTVNFFTDSACTMPVDKLVNGLPWNGGVYYAKIEVTFDDGADYQSFAATLSFAVSKLAVRAEWDATDAATYNGNGQGRGVSVANARYSTADCNEDSDGVNLTVTYDGAANKPVSVKYSGGTVVSYAAQVVGTDNENYTVAGGSGLTSSFTITPKRITVTANALNYVYGDGLGVYENIDKDNYFVYFTIDAGAVCNDGDYSGLKLVIGGERDGRGLPYFGGSYTLTPELKTEQGNYTLDAVSSALTVLKREITVTAACGAGSVYGVALDFNGDGRFELSKNGLGTDADGNGIDAGGVFRLYLSGADGFRADDGNGKVPVGNYTVMLESADGNYTISFTPADYGITSAKLEGVSASGYTGRYDGGEHEVLSSLAATAVNPDENEVTYYALKKTGGEKPDASAFADEKKKISHVAESGEYWIKVSAPNHADEIILITVTVTRAAVEVSVNLDIYYGERSPEDCGPAAGKWFKQSFDDLIAENGIYTFTGFIGDDFDRFKSGAGLDREGFSYGFGGKAYSAGDPVGEYPLVFDARTLADEYYDYAFVDGGNGKLTVQRLPITVTVRNLTAVYNGQNPDGADGAVTSVTTSVKSVYDGATVEIYGVEDFTNIITAATDALKPYTAGGLTRTTNRVGVYDITLTADGNYDAEYEFADGGVKAVYEITKAVNAVVDGYRPFTVAPSYDKELQDGDAAAWVYGDYGAAHTGGYNPNGDQKTVEATFDYDEENAAAKYTLYLNGSALGEDTTLSALMDTVHRAGKLGAGDYGLTVRFPAGDNYLAAQKTVYFRVDKNTVTVTAGDRQVIYGDGIGDYTGDAQFVSGGKFPYSVSGLVASDGTGVADGLSEVTEFVLATAYAAGKPVGGYAIFVDEIDGVKVGDYQNAYEYAGAENYTVIFRNGTVTVEKRALTIRIDDKSNHFDLYNLGYGNESLQGYTFRLESGSFCEGHVAAGKNIVASLNTSYPVGDQTVFVLKSDAVDLKGVNNTADAGIYSIYAIFNGGDYADNYEITVNGSTDCDKAGAIGDRAGTFTIEKAPIMLTNPRGYKFEGGVFTEYTQGVDVYDGLRKYYRLSGLDGILNDKGIQIKYAYYFRSGDQTVGEPICVITDDMVRSGSAEALKTPKDVGSYRVAFVLDNPNYESYTTQQDYEIGKKTLGVVKTVNDDSVSWDSSNRYYRGAAYTFTLKFTGLVDGDNLSGLATPVFTGIAAAAEYSFESPYDTVTYTAVNAGNYGMTFNFDGVKNYGLAGDNLRHEFTIARRILSVSAENATIGYSTPLEKFGGFKVHYSVAAVAGTPESFIADEIAAGNLKDPSHISCGVAGYSVSTPVHTAGLVIEADIDGVQIKGNNFAVNLSPNKGTLTVVPRKLNVTVYGYYDAVNGGSAAWDYVGDSRGFHQEKLTSFLKSEPTKFLEVDGSDADWYLGLNKNTLKERLNALDISLNVGESVKDAGDYGITLGCGNGNYDITFLNAAGENVTDAGAQSGKLPVYRVKKLKLSVKVAPQGAGVYDYGAFNVIYGNSAEYGRDYSLVFSGWLNADEGTATAIGNAARRGDFNKVSAPAINGTTKYAAWTSNAGEIYKILPVIESGSIEFTNYEIVPVEVTATVVPRTVSAVAADNVYTADDGATNGGRFGLERPAEITFADGSGSLTAFGVAPVYTLGYSATVGGAYSATAPAVAGEFFVKVTVTDGNYAFEGGAASVAVPYRINKRAINLLLSDTQFDYDAVNAIKPVPAFKADIMTIVSFSRTLQNNVTDDLIKDGATYGDGLEITPDKLGRYTVTVRFNDYAVNNYEWSEGGERVALTFWVIAEGSEISIAGLNIDDWAFNQAASNPTAEIAPAGASGSISFSYARVTQDTAGLVRGVKLPEELPVCGAFGINPVNAGWYVLKASLTSGDIIAEAYFLFEIKRAEVTLPEFGIISGGENANTVYTGDALYTLAKFDNRELAIYYGGNWEYVAGGAGLYALNKGDYTVTFAIADSGNYKWPDGVDLSRLTVQADGVTHLIAEWSADGTRLIFTQTVKAADDNTVVWETGDITAVYGDGYTAPKANSNKYGQSRVVIEYAPYGGETGGELVPAGVKWTTDAYDCGEYWIRATVSPVGAENFNTAVSYKRLTIEKRALSVTVSGTLVYGQTFAQAALGYEVTGFVGRDTQGNSLTVTDGVEYILADAGVNGNELHVRAGGYALTLKADGGMVAGISSDNYYLPIENVGGTLTVEKAAVTVRIGSVNSYYREAISLAAAEEGLSLVDGAIALWDDGTDLKRLFGITLTTQATVTSAVDNYEITCSGWNNDDYAVAFFSGTYRIDPLQISVDIKPGGGTYGDASITGVTVEKVYKTVNGHRSEISSDGITFNYVYSGVNNAGDAYNSSECPKDAGTYLATVLNAAGGNYVLTGTASVPFEVKKKEIDAGLITVVRKTYTGEPLKVEIRDDVYAEGTYELLNPDRTFVNAGEHTVTLRMKDFCNMKWKSVDIAERELAFTIEKADNAVIGSISVNDWIYGQYDAAANLPRATVKFGNDGILFLYSSSRDGEYLPGAPRNDGVGTYWVKLSVPADPNGNYNELKYENVEPVSFKITPIIVDAPQLVIVTGGDGANNVYTGADLSAALAGFDRSAMTVHYDGNLSVSGNSVKVFARNAGVYEVRVALVNAPNYAWAAGVETDGDGMAVLSWTVGRKKVEKPVRGAKTYFVNGSVIEFIPEGFDGEIMSIAGNSYGYGGEFTAVIALKDTANYEWSDGTDGEISITWEILGSNTLFGIIMGSLSGGVVIVAVAAIWQFVVYRKKKLAEAKADGDGEAKI